MISRKAFFKVIRWILGLGLFVFLAFVGFLIYHFNFVVSGPRSRTPFAEARERAVKTFVEGEGFGVRRFREKEFFHESSVMMDGEEWHVEGVSLIGATDEYGERYFTEQWVPLKKRVADTKHRKLTKWEAGAIADLRKGEENHVVSDKENFEWGTTSRHVIAPIRAEETCLKCHEVEEDDVLGAMDYLLTRRKKASTEGKIE
ncbi:DUF3365 domain-containing protein [Akkermansiaceae bacterium]|jgi:hypothetical protein|nr:DUF3365 domain-containing protein [Akkermansiaceae bacterium]